ncbi:hypothetical protein [Archangium sp.]|uniref:hypothetical protein n=1 Tax=Archangium sp. TaxID=1872627 RepID=UPI002D78800F|nr:hypothetical protein [Archangium sp.]
MGGAWCGLFALVTFWAGCGPSIAEAPEVDAPRVRVEEQVTGGEGQTRWVRRSVNVPEREVLGQGITIDRDDNTIAIGIYKGTPDFGSGPLPPLAQPDGFNAFLVKYTSEGRLLWACGFGALQVEAGDEPVTLFAQVVTDHRRHITIIGNASGPVDFGRGLVPAGPFIVQFDSDGDLRWVRHIPQRTLADRVVLRELAVDREDHLLVVGSITGRADFGGGPRTSTGDGAFVAKYTREGGYVWDRVFDTPDFSSFTGVATDGNNHVYVSGFFRDRANFGGGTLSGPGTDLAVIARFTPSGAHVWSRTLEDVTGVDERGELRLSNIAVHGNRVVVVGEFRGSIRFAGRTLTSTRLSRSGLVLAMTRDGEDRWGRTLGFLVQQVRADLEDDVTVLGIALPGEDVGTGPLPATPAHHIFISKFDRVNGVRDWVRTFDAQTVGFASLGVARHGEVAVTGGFDAPVDFGTGTIVPSSDFTEAFIFRTFP